MLRKSFQASARNFYKSKCQLVCWSVGQFVPGKYVESKIQNSLIIFDYLIIFWNCLVGGCLEWLRVGGGSVRVIG